MIFGFTRASLSVSDRSSLIGIAEPRRTSSMLLRDGTSLGDRLALTHGADRYVSRVRAGRALGLPRAEPFSFMRRNSSDNHAAGFAAMAAMGGYELV